MIFKGVINKQAAPSPQTTILPIPSFSSNFVLCSSVVRLKRKGNYFTWIEIISSSLIQSLTFQLKANDCVWSNFVCLSQMLVRDASPKQRIPCIILISIFGAFSAEKSVHYTRVNTVNTSIFTGCDADFTMNAYSSSSSSTSCTYLSFFFVSFNFPLDLGFTGFGDFVLHC